MVTAYSTGPEDVLHGIGSNNVRRRSSTFRNRMIRSSQISGGHFAEDAESATNPPVNPLSLSATRRLSLLNTPRRKLPWLDGKVSSDKEEGHKHRHVPGEFVSDDDTSWSAMSNNARPSPTRLESPTPKPPFNLHVPNNASSVYTSSTYSTGAVSSMSVGPPIQNPRPQKSYEALISPPEAPPTWETKRDKRHSRRTDSYLEDAVAVTLRPRSPVSLERVSPLPILSAEPREGSAQLLQPTPAETGLRKTIKGTENLTHKAIDVAKYAADHHKSDRVSEVLEGAARSLERTPTPASRMDPLLVSDSLDTSSNETPTELENSLSPKTSYSSHTAMLPKQPSAEKANPVCDIHIRGDSAASSQRNQSSSPNSIVLTPKQFYTRGSVESIATDWAYVKSKPPTRNPSPSMSSTSTATSTPSDIERQQSSHWRAWHHNIERPVYSDGSHPTDRHVHYDNNSPPTKEEVHDHIKRHGVPPTPPRSSSMRYRNVNTRTHQHFQRARDRRKERRSEREERYGGPKRRKPPQPWDELNPESTKGFGMGHPARTHVSYRGAEGLETFSRQRRQPIARNWGTTKKRITAAIACVNTALVGFLIGVYAGEVPRIQYAIADQGHIVIMGNVFLYLGLAISTFFCWPLPLLHGRKPYILGSLAILLPLQFPQALVVGAPRDPNTQLYRVGLLLPRALSGLILGFANVNFIAILLDLFGASLQAANPHEELVFVNDARRHGGGMGLWLGIWAWSFLASIAVGFMVGAVLINSVDPSWGFYIIVILIACVLVLNVIAPETRRARFRRSAIDLVDPQSEYVYQRIVRGEIKLHISPDGPDWWGQEVAAGIKLSLRMFFQLGFGVLAMYIAWIYAQFVLIIVLLGALLSRDYRWHPHHVGAAVAALALGALLAIPLTKAGLLSRERTRGPRTDSMTFAKQVTWTSHMTRRIVFTTLLPLTSLAYTFLSRGPSRRHSIHPALPILFATIIAFLSCLAWAETHGLVMEAFDTCDLQPGTNTRHRLQSMADVDRRRRTAYSAFPRVAAGLAGAHSAAFALAAVATWVGGVLTRHYGAQASTGVVAAVLGVLTVALTGVLWRVGRVQVIPDDVFGQVRSSMDTGVTGGRLKGSEEDNWRAAMMVMSGGAGSPDDGDDEKGKKKGRDHAARPEDWKPVIIGNPSGRVRRVNVLELGRWSRWSEIRRLNGLLRE